MFCRHCLEEPVASCPVCRRERPTIGLLAAFPQRMLGNNRVRCRYPECAWQGDFGIQGGGLAAHRQACGLRPWSCPYACGAERLRHIDEEKHASVCPRAPTPCRHGCGQVLGRAAEIAHAEECDAILTPCEFSVIGCDVRLPRSRLPQHHTDPASLQAHLRMLLRRAAHQSDPLIPPNFQPNHLDIPSALAEGNIAQVAWLLKNRLDALEEYDPVELLKACVPASTPTWIYLARARRWTVPEVVQFCRSQSWSAKDSGNNSGSSAKPLSMDTPQWWFRLRIFLRTANVPLMELAAHIPAILQDRIPPYPSSNASFLTWVGDLTRIFGVTVATLAAENRELARQALAKGLLPGDFSITDGLQRRPAWLLYVDEKFAGPDEYDSVLKSLPGSLDMLPIDVVDGSTALMRLKYIERQTFSMRRPMTHTRTVPSPYHVPYGYGAPGPSHQQVHDRYPGSPPEELGILERFKTIPLNVRNAHGRTVFDIIDQTYSAAAVPAPAASAPGDDVHVEVSPQDKKRVLQLLLTKLSAAHATSVKDAYQLVVKELADLSLPEWK